MSYDQQKKHFNIQVGMPFLLGDGLELVARKLPRVTWPYFTRLPSLFNIDGLHTMSLTTIFDETCRHKRLSENMAVDDAMAIHLFNGQGRVM